MWEWLGEGGGAGVSPSKTDQDEFPEQHQEGAKHWSDWEEEETDPSEYQGLYFKYIHLMLYHTLDVDNEERDGSDDEMNAT